jgi:hypothetical protein
MRKSKVRQMCRHGVMVGMGLDRERDQIAEEKQGNMM